MPRILARSISESCTMSRPATVTLPPEIWQPGRAYPINVSAMVVLPEPLSPISATISPSAISMSTPLMIWMRRPGIGGGLDFKPTDFNEIGHYSLLSRIFCGRLSINRLTLIVRLAIASDGRSRPVRQRAGRRCFHAPAHPSLHSAVEGQGRGRRGPTKAAR